MKIGYTPSTTLDLTPLAQSAPHYIDIVPIPPPSHLQNLTSTILEQEIKALIVTYQLSHEDGTTYLGTDLIKHLASEKDAFPLFLLAPSHLLHEAEKKVPNVHIVYDQKQVLTHIPRFLQRIATQVEKEKQKLQAQETRLLQLMQRSTTLSAQEETEVNALNFTLEKSLNKRIAKDLQPFTLSHQKKIDHILTKTDAILNALEKHA